MCASVAPGNLVLGIGDDAAAWRPSRSNLSVITTDALIEDVHFTQTGMSAREVGHRALAANLSDIAAMGARPVLATIALGLGAHPNLAWIYEFYEGLTTLAQRYGCAIAGGDITRSPTITIAITVTGEVRASNMKRRSGARAGDIVALSGPLGASRAGLGIVRDHPEFLTHDEYAPLVAHFRTPEPRLHEGAWFAASRNVHALMDSSDGLATDLARMCAASSCGARVDTVAVAPLARAYALALGEDPESYALSGGEDFELIAAIDARAFRYLAGRYRQRFGRELIAVGAFTEGSGVRFANGAAIASSGWDHLRG